MKETKKNVKESLKVLFALMHEEVIKVTGSGSTASVVCVQGNKLYVAHVGDSPVFLVRENNGNKTIETVTINHHPDIEEERQSVEKRGGI